MSRVNDQWLHREDKENRKLNEYLVKKSEYEVNCFACSSNINVKKSGQKAITAHLDTRKHCQNVKNFFDKKQQRLDLGPFSLANDGNNKQAMPQLTSFLDGKDGRKELAIGIRAWNKNINRVDFSHLETFFISSATSDNRATNVILGTIKSQ